jgi:hypothetical protein
VDRHKSVGGTGAAPRAIDRRTALAAVKRIWVRRPGRPVSFESRLVWMFGSPRSGSTWLLHLLCHPLVPAQGSACGVARLSAPDADAPPAIPLNEPYAQSHLAPSLAQELVASGKLPFGTVNALRRGDPNYLLCDRYEQAWRRPLRELVLGRLAAQVREVARVNSVRGALPIIIKEPNGSIGADVVMALFPRARMIFLLRDGRDVTDSMLDARLPGGWLADLSAPDAARLAERRMEIVRQEAQLWRARTQAVMRAYDAHPPRLRRLVRYEDARRNPGAVLAELEQWLGLRRTPRGRADALRWNDFDAVPSDAKGSGKPLRAAEPGLWRRNLDGAEQDAMQEILGAQLQQLGYEL